MIVCNLSVFPDSSVQSIKMGIVGMPKLRVTNLHALRDYIAGMGWNLHVRFAGRHYAALLIDQLLHHPTTTEVLAFIGDVCLHSDY